jgi:hypothetical protein
MNTSAEGHEGASNTERAADGSSYRDRTTGLLRSCYRVRMCGEGATEHSRDAGATRECITTKGHDRHETEREREPRRSPAPWLGCDPLRAAAIMCLWHLTCSVGCCR